MEAHKTADATVLVSMYACMYVCLMQIVVRSVTGMVAALHDLSIYIGRIEESTQWPSWYLLVHSLIKAIAFSSSCT